MIYLIGGAPRAGKSILGQRVAATLRIGWISTDSLMDILRVHDSNGIKTTWDASPQALQTNAEWFYPYLDRFIWGINSMTEHYLIEGVDFHLDGVTTLSKQYAIRVVFLGNSQLTLESFEQFGGRSRGYGNLPDALRQQIVKDVPIWSEFIRQETERFGFPYFDMGVDFDQELDKAHALLTRDA